MIYDIEKRLVSLHNELKALKVYSGLAYSSLLLPENTPSSTYSGTANLPGSGTGPVARVRFRFSRNDNLTDPPLINFAFNVSYAPQYQDFLRSHGFTISGNDLDYFDWIEASGYISEVGDGYVDFYVDLDSSIRDYFFNISSLPFTITCQAIANVNGELIEERLI